MGIGLDTLEEKGFQVTFQENMQAAMTADEIVTEDLFATIDYNKRVRLEHAKENIAFEHAEHREWRHEFMEEKKNLLCRELTTEII